MPCGRNSPELVKSQPKRTESTSCILACHTQHHVVLANKIDQLGPFQHMPKISPHNPTTPVTASHASYISIAYIWTWQKRRHSKDALWKEFARACEEPALTNGIHIMHSGMPYSASRGPCQQSRSARTTSTHAKSFYLHLHMFENRKRTDFQMEPLQQSPNCPFQPAFLLMGITVFLQHVAGKKMGPSTLWNAQLEDGQSPDLFAKKNNNVIN